MHGLPMKRLDFWCGSESIEDANRELSFLKVTREPRDAGTPGK